MIKWLVIVAAGYFLFRMFTNDSRHKKKDTKQDLEAKVATGELVKDPVCGTYIDADGGITVRNGDTVHRFCSYECRDKFIKRVQQGQSPENAKVEAAETAEAVLEPEVEATTEKSS